jgi:hypothetical protein
VNIIQKDDKPHHLHHYPRKLVLNGLGFGMALSQGVAHDKPSFAGYNLSFTKAIPI